MEEPTPEIVEATKIAAIIHAAVTRFLRLRRRTGSMLRTVAVTIALERARDESLQLCISP